jgi:release factor glutamine methyltransferase
MPNVSAVLKDLSARLRTVSDTAALDAQVLLGHVLDKNRSWVLAHPSAPVAGEEMFALQKSVASLESGFPLPYLLGHWEFYGLDFRISPSVLIPRPETEDLVERALQFLRSRPDGAARPLAADVGTGSGCIAVTLAYNIPALQVVATDISYPALAQARRNAVLHRVDQRVHYVQANMLAPTRKRYDLICANLPYIPSGELAHMKVARFEPRLALSGGPDGLDYIRHFLMLAPQAVAPGGLVLMEIEERQGPAVRILAGSTFRSARVDVLPDLAGKDRLVTIQIPAPENTR